MAAIPPPMALIPVTIFVYNDMSCSFLESSEVSFFITICILSGYNEVVTFEKLLNAGSLNNSVLLGIEEFCEYDIVEVNDTETDIINTHINILPDFKYLLI